MTTNEKIKALLVSIEGVTNIKHYLLVNNEGYTFEYRGFKFDLRHWRNCYGVAMNNYSLMNNSTPLNYESWIEEFSKVIDRLANEILKEGN